MKPVWIVLLFAAGLTYAAETNELTSRLGGLEQSLGQIEAKLSRQLNELLWWQRLADVATIDKVRFTGPPARTITNAAPPAGSNEVIVSAMTFLPRSRALGRKLPLIVFAHSEIHGNLVSDEEAHIVRDLIRHGYAVIAPDYRGSS